MTGLKRWVLLVHFCSPDDPIGMHFDLLLEDVQDCRTWRLQNIPVLDGPPEEVTPLSSHQLDWLETPGRLLSGGRGFARPLFKGFFVGVLPTSFLEPFSVKLSGSQLIGVLAISNHRCQLLSANPARSNL